MKQLSLIVLFYLLSVLSYSQNEIISQINDRDEASNDVFSSGQDQLSLLSTRSQVSEWWDFTKSLSLQINNEKYIYSLLFPDTVRSIFEGSTSGTYSLSRVRDHSVGVVFCPRSDIMEGAGYAKFSNKQPYNVDTIAIQYNYNRYSTENIADTLIINLFKPSKLLYYQNSGNPRGCSMGYDLANNKGRNYTQEVKIPLTNADTITYKWRGKGWINIPLSGFAITAGTYGNPVGFTITYKPVTSYSISDTLNGDFIPTLPHSPINNFYFWNLTDYDKNEVEEWNNGVFIYSFSGSPRYKYETSNGNVYYKGKDFANRTCYPVAKFKITYDPGWVGVAGNKTDTGFFMYPNPVIDNLSFSFINHLNGTIDVILTNIQGQIKSAHNFKNIQAGQINCINVSDLEKGVYFLKINTSEGSFVRTFIKE